MGLFRWPPPKRSCMLKILVPISTVSIKQSQILRLVTIWEIARAAAIIRCTHLLFYKDLEADNRKVVSLIEKTLHYLLTPPYLRKKVIPLDPQLNFVGMLNPLALPIHYRKDDPILGSIRLALIELRNGVIVAHIGADKPCTVINVKTSDYNKMGPLQFVKVVSLNPLLCKPVQENSIEVYTGFKYRFYNSLKEALNKECRNSVLIEFSKLGIDARKALRYLRAIVSNRKIDNLCIVFGSPSMDASEILVKENGIDIPSYAKSQLHAYYLRINAVPYQGVRSIRTHEALYLALSILNFMLFDLKICHEPSKNSST